MEVALNLDPLSPIALYRQIYDGLRDGIIGERFEGGTRLPASRAFAASLGVSRITVTECYERLISEGYLETRRGSGTFVCSRLPERDLYASGITAEAPPQLHADVPMRLSRYGEIVNAPIRPPTPPEIIRCDRHGPDVSLFPNKLWARLWARRMQEGAENLLQYTQEYSGNNDLRVAIAQYLRKSRAVVCDPSQVIITSGSQQAIYLTARIFLDPSDYVALETPGYLFAGRIFASQSAKLLPIPVDRHGMQVSQLKKHREKSVKLVYITPSHQYPRGVSLSISRRMELLDWAKDTGTLIFEDDYDSEYRYNERPLPSIQGMVPDAPVLYVGTFSKLLFPTLRLGYLVVPPALHNVFTGAKLLCDFQSSSIDQRILADFMAEGHLEPHVRKMRIIYGNRRALLAESLQKHFGRKVTILGDHAGMHFLADFQINLSEEDAFARALAAGVRVERVYWPAGSSVQRPGHVQFVFAFASLSENNILLATERLAQALLV
ncbi:PLP-dependent aminotransferase family protein [Granulicella sp. S190]|uniref:MocR-like pyridoxine biosynthesis transcription factor PdxR n=1 Tax=Granulicella sp. S190 TaxID=1747226 RepID=UPI00131B5CC8|nr:PLP-dependent aminotransferase family protein [Granulicella sp. S190]